MWKVQLFKLNFDQREADSVASVINSGWLTMGDKTKEFELAFSHFLGDRAGSVAVSNGTAALHMSLLAADVGPGDEVVIPALTFVADANAVLLTGATPVLADCQSYDMWNVSVETIEPKVTEKTKAVVIVHYAGYPCDVAPIQKFCRARGIVLIEDVAHAPGATVQGIACGTWGDYGCFSFFSNKNLSVGEGGMVTSVNPAAVESLRLLRSHGMTSLTLDRHKGRAITYDVALSGLNYRMDEMRAAIGLVQLEKLAAGNAQRKALTGRYRDRLATSSCSMPFTEPVANSESSYHILPVLLPKGLDRNAVIEELKAEGIQSSIHYPAFWSFSAFEGRFTPNDAPIASEVCERELTLPLYPTMTDDEVDLVTSVLIQASS